MLERTSIELFLVLLNLRSTECWVQESMISALVWMMYCATVQHAPPGFWCLGGGDVGSEDSCLLLNHRNNRNYLMHSLSMQVLHCEPFIQMFALIRKHFLHFVTIMHGKTYFHIMICGDCIIMYSTKTEYSTRFQQARFQQADGKALYKLYGHTTVFHPYN